MEPARAGDQADVPDAPRGGRPAAHDSGESERLATPGKIRGQLEKLLGSHTLGHGHSRAELLVVRSHVQVLERLRWRTHATASAAWRRITGLAQLVSSLARSSPKSERSKRLGGAWVSP